MATVTALTVGMVAGCSHSLTQAEIKFLETREINRPYPQVYDAALNAIFSLGMTIQHSDKSSGVISGQVGDYAHRATLSGRQRRKHPVTKVTLLVVPRGPRATQLRMKVLINEEPQMDRKLMTAIWQRIEREAMLDDRPRRHHAANVRPRR